MATNTRRSASHRKKGPLKRGWALGVAVALIAPAGVGAPGPPAGPPSRGYTITDLGALPGCTVTYATGINQHGWVVGYGYHYVAPGHGGSVMSQPYLWREGRMARLPTLGGEHGQALAINSRGEIGGYAERPDSAGLPVLWRPGAKPKAVRQGDRAGRISQVLDDGSAAGVLWDGAANRAAVWRDGRAQIVGDPTDAESAALGINRSGTVVGFSVPNGRPIQSFMSPGDRHATLWQRGKQTALPEMGGKLSECDAINNDGIAVGWCDTQSGRSACTWIGGEVAPLPAPPGSAAEAGAINSSGVIVGSVRTGRNWYACLWWSGKLLDLNRLVPARSGWHLTVAKAISDRGQIVGIGSCDKHPDHLWRAFLLTPVR